MGIVLAPLACDRGTGLTQLASVADAKDPSSAPSDSDAAEKPHDNNSEPDESTSADEAAGGQPDVTGDDQRDDEEPEVLEHPFPPPPQGAVARRRRGLDQHGRADRPEGPPRQVRAARLLDLLLHQLHAHPAGAEEAGAGVSQRARGDRRALGQVRRPRRTRKNIADAVLRYEIEHPVVNDADHEIWDSYGVSSWPTLRVIDPEGNARRPATAARSSSRCSTQFFKQALPYYRSKGLLDETPLRFDLEAVRRRQRRRCAFPARCWPTRRATGCSSPTATTTASSIATLDGKLLDVIGSGRDRRATTATIDQATFDHPQGMALDGETLYVADTENHLLRKVDLKHEAGHDDRRHRRARPQRLAGHRRSAPDGADGNAARSLGRPAAEDGAQQPLGPVDSRQATCTSRWPGRTRFGRCRSMNRRSAPTPATAARTSSMARCCRRAPYEAGLRLVRPAERPGVRRQVAVRGR